MQQSKSPHLIPIPEQVFPLRHQLHQHPELSGQEHATSHTLQAFLAQFKPDQFITNLAGSGFAAVFEGEDAQGPTLLFRAELDALPIVETNELPYTSQQPGVSHKCGHDGHMAILAGLAGLLQKQPLQMGKIVLLFQPAEETGAGAWAVLQEPRFLELKPDFVFALHNMPGLPLGQILVRNNTFSAASVGLVVQLYGKESHAAEPENGLNPGEGMSELIQAFNAIVRDQQQFESLTLLTVVHARLGEVAFGTNPGFATVMVTLRAFEQNDLNKLKSLALEEVELVSNKYGLKYDIKWVEEFPATVNDPKAVEHVQRAGRSLGLEVKEAVEPVRWSEDFGHFTKQYPGALFGLGAGTSQPQLHHADYDFPDELIPVGANLFYQITRQITQS